MGISYITTGKAKGIGDYADQTLDNAGITCDGGIIVDNV